MDEYIFIVRNFYGLLYSALYSHELYFSSDIEYVIMKFGIRCL